MTGLPNFNRDSFNAKAKEFTNEGHTVLNPAILPDGLTEREYMQICLLMLSMCGEIYMLKGWEDSAGAKIEYNLAVKSGLRVTYA